MSNDTEAAVQARTKLFELLFIIPNKYTDDEVPGIMKTVNGLIQNQGGKVIKEINYGKRRLAYPVKHNHYGYYILDHFELEPKNLKILNNTIRVQDEILRHLITIALPEDAMPDTVGDLKQSLQLQKPEFEKNKEAESEKISRKKPSITDIAATAEEKEKLAKGTSFDLEKELGVTAKEAQEAFEQEGELKKEKESSVDLDQLDKQLDQIISDLE